MAAYKSGMRLGELSALKWGDVDLVAGVARVRRTYTDGILSETKTSEIRDVDLIGELVETLGAWWGELGRPGDETLVFPGATVSGYLNPKTVLSELYGALAAAGVPRVGATGGARVFHSWRHTFAKTALENGPLDHLAAAAARALVDHGHDRPIRPLGSALHAGSKSRLSRVRSPSTRRDWRNRRASV